MRDFFFHSKLAPHLRYLAPRNQRARRDRSHLNKYWLLYSVLRLFTCKSFPARWPSNFYVQGVEFLIRLLLSLCCFHCGCQTSQLHSEFSLPGMRICCLKQIQQRVEAPNGRIGSCKDLPDCSLSHKKWKLFSVFCQELGKLCQLSLTILTDVGIC